MPVTPLRRLRVDDHLWNAFGEATEAIDSDRTKVLVAFMRRFVEAMRTPSAESAKAITPEG